MKEQTISNLKKLKSFHNGSYGADINRAIQALEQQPCEDCISREALLKNLEEPMNWTDSEAEIQEQRDYEGFIELVKSMPSVTPSIEDWLSSFNTESATCCFTAVQQLQEKLNGKMD